MSIANKLYDGSFSCEKVINQVSKETFFLFLLSFISHLLTMLIVIREKEKNKIKIRIVGQISSIFNLKTPVQHFMIKLGFHV